MTTSYQGPQSPVAQVPKSPKEGDQRWESDGRAREQTCGLFSSTRVSVLPSRTRYVNTGRCFFTPQTSMNCTEWVYHGTDTPNRRSYVVLPSFRARSTSGHTRTLTSQPVCTATRVLNNTYKEGSIVSNRLPQLHPHLSSCCETRERGE